MFNFYKKIFSKVTGNKQKPKNKTMGKKLSPEKKKKIFSQIKKGVGTIYNKIGSTEKTARPTVARTAVKVPTPPAKSKIKPLPIKKVKPVSKPAPKQSIVVPEKNFWKDRIDMGIIKPTGTQLVVGGTATVIAGSLLVNHLRK